MREREAGIVKDGSFDYGVSGIFRAGGKYTGAIVMELPDAATGAAFSMVAEATGAFVEVATMEVLTSSELDRALAKTIAYRPPGG